MKDEVAILRYRRYGNGFRLRIDDPSGRRYEWPVNERYASIAEAAMRDYARWGVRTADLRDRGPIRKDEALRLLAARGASAVGDAPYRCSQCKRPFSCRTAFDRHQEIINERPGVRCHVPEEVGLVWRGDRRGAPAFGWPPSGSEIPPEPSTSPPVQDEGSNAKSAESQPVGERDVKLEYHRANPLGA